jgi:hypothetical protein
MTIHDYYDCHMFYRFNLFYVIMIESRLEGVNRHNMKFTTLNTHYKSELALELYKIKSGREGETNQMEIKRMNTVICFTEARFQRT